MIEKQESNSFVYNSKNSKTDILFLYIFLFAIITFFTIYFLLPGELVISEVCSHNSNIIHDYYGEYSDYVEIHNISNREIDLSYYYLSDESNDLHKMPLPNYKLSPDEYYVVFLDSYTATFKLSDGENIYLTNSNGKIISKLDIPILKTDMSYSLNDEGEYLISFPTPGDSFSNYTIEGKETISNIEINANYDSGFYDKEFYLELSSTDDLDIYYTLDSSEPNIYSTKYNGRILIADKSSDENIYSNINDISTEIDYCPNTNVNKCTIVRAIGIDSSGHKTGELIRSFFVGYKNKKGYNDIPTISLITNPDNLFDYENGIYVKGKTYYDYQDYKELKISGTKIGDMHRFNSQTRPANYWVDTIRGAYIEYFDTDKVLYFEDIDFGIHGGWTRSFNQKSFNLFKRENKENSIFGIFGNNDSLMIRSGGDDAYLTKIRDVINQKLYEDRDVLTQEYSPVQVFIDGEYWGVYMIQERVDKSSIAKKYNVEQDDVLLIKNDDVIKDTKDYISEYTEVVDYISNNDMTVDKNYEEANKLIDMQSFIDFKCFEIYSNRSDGSMRIDQNNVALWKTKRITGSKWYDGKFRYILFDADSAAERSDESFLMSNLFHSLENDSMFSSLIKNDQFKKQFIITYIDVINSNFNYEKIHKEIYDLANFIGDSVVESNKRFIDADFTIDDYMKNVADYDDFYLKRKEYAIKNLIEDFNINSDKYNVRIINDLGITYKLNTINSSGDFNGEYFNLYPISLSTEDECVIGWLINDSLYKEKNISIDLKDDLTIIPVMKES